jgi:hypothetical protein
VKGENVPIADDCGPLIKIVAIPICTLWAGGVDASVNFKDGDSSG